jgi:hypothetical protein
MHKFNRQLIIFTVAIVVLCFLSVLIFTLPATIKQLDLSTNGNIGSSLGGITAPIIGIITSVLLYITLNRQVESNSDQRLKNESDIIFLLLNQLENEMATFYYTFTEKKQGSQEQEHVYHGFQGLNEFVWQFTKERKLSDFNYTFKEFYASNQIQLLIRSYELIEMRIELSKISSDLKNMFHKKLRSFYDCRLKDALTQLGAAIEQNPNMKDSVTDEIKTFVKSKSN